MARQFKRASFGRALFDGALPLDMVIQGSIVAQERPSILSRRGDAEDYEATEKEIEHAAS